MPPLVLHHRRIADLMQSTHRCVLLVLCVMTAWQEGITNNDFCGGVNHEEGESKSDVAMIHGGWAVISKEEDVCQSLERSRIPKGMQYWYP